MASAKESAGRRAVDDAVPSNSALEDIDAAFSNIPDDATIALYRRQPDTGKWGLLDSFAPDLFNVKLVADKWGGGTYNALASARVKGKPGRPRVANVQFTVDPAVGKKEEAAPGVSSGSRLNDVLEASYVQALSSMMQTMQATAEAARKPAPEYDWVAIAGAASPIIVALLEKRVDPLATAAKLVELTRPDGKAPEFAQLFDVFSQGLEFASDQKPDGLGRIADTVTQFIERTAQKEGAPKMLQPGDTQAPPQAPPTAQPAGPPWLNTLRPFFPYLIKMATANKNPELYAEWLVDQLPAEHVPAIVALTADPAYPENVIAVLPPQVAHLADWFRVLCLGVARILEEYAKTETPPPAPTPTPAHDGPTFARPPLQAHEVSGGYVKSGPTAEEDEPEDEH